MTPNPSRTLRLAAEFFPLLDLLASKGESASLSVIRGLLSQRMPEENRSADQIISLLNENGLLEVSAESDAEWDVPHAVGEFIRHLSMRQRLASPGQIVPVLNESTELTDRMQSAFANHDLDAIRYYGGRAKEALDAARSLGQENYRAILNEVMRIKSRKDNRTLRERFLFIHELHERHLTPLGGLVDVGGEMDKRLNDLHAVIKDGMVRMHSEPYVPEMISKLTSAIRRLRDEAWQDYHSALREVTPLFRQIRRDHAMAAAAGAILEAVSRTGAKALDDICDRLPIARWKADNLFSIYALENYLVDVEQHVARPELGPLSMRVDSPLDMPIDDQELTEKLSAEMPVDNLLGWLFASYPKQNEHHVLHAFQQIITDPSYAMKISSDSIQTTTPDAVFTYHPVRIEDAART